MYVPQSYSKVCAGRNPHQNSYYYYYPIIPPHPHPSTPWHPHFNMPPHHYPSISRYPMCLCPYFTSTSMYSPYVVSHHPHITSLVYPHRTTSRLPSFVLPNLLPPGVCPHSSRSMSKHRGFRMNQRSNLTNNRGIDPRIRREGRGGIAPKYQDLVDTCKNSVYIDESQEE